MMKPKIVVEPPPTLENRKTPRKKKKRKKDKFCGLNKSVVQAVTPELPTPSKPKSRQEIKKEKKQILMKKKKQNEKISKLASILNTTDVSKSYLKDFLINN